MEYFMEKRNCKYCEQNLEICYDEGLQCLECKNYVHIRCLKRGSVPGGLNGDLFYTYKCQECSSSGNEVFSRNKISWLQVISLVLYHLQTKNPGLARKGFFHWRNHVATFVDRNWEILFSYDVKKKKKWTGTIAGTLSHFSSYIFLSGTSTFNEPAWWTLMYPKLSPSAISNLHSLMTIERQKAKIRNEKKSIPDTELFQFILSTYIKNEELSQPFSVTNMPVLPDIKEEECIEYKKDPKQKNTGFNKRKSIFQSIENASKKLMKVASSSSTLSDELTVDFSISDSQEEPQPSTSNCQKTNKTKEPVKLLDPLCHFNTSLSNIARTKGLSIQTKITGGRRVELIYSQYTGRYLKPFIWIDVETIPPWVKLMTGVLIVGNRNNRDYSLPSRSSVDYMLVQPEHIPAINSLCNQFFWPGIDLTETLLYPDFSCVVMYEKLVVAFAFLVPDVSPTEYYLSFMFTRPGWRNCGIATFMLYFLIQASLGKDITLHVQVTNPAMMLYQKFGFKIERMEQNFYDKYIRDDRKESKHAFFCRFGRL